MIVGHSEKYHPVPDGRRWWQQSSPLSSLPITPTGSTGLIPARWPRLGGGGGGTAEVGVGDSYSLTRTEKGTQNEETSDRGKGCPPPYLGVDSYQEPNNTSARGHDLRTLLGDGYRSAQSNRIPATTIESTSQSLHHCHCPRRDSLARGQRRFLGSSGCFVNLSSFDSNNTN